ncbi:siderophore-interacting protein [Homoserinibacter sp. GY 40078]|uniref:siderophore-interacting protein n=1 Tax=Homoserinibacter sp. GY 40078 TaxID=2603275 RepID=UPI0011C85E1C|nr:siderophore-interacting protein [Homoserinibacter sp. GY 40078]TXK19900.1 siderophore-interacting protein [Homoserinibacter sp. GY 40078]
MTAHIRHSGRVIARREITPHMVRVTIGDIRIGDEAPTLGIRADEFFAISVPVPSGEPVHRYYTARAWRAEAGELDIDLMLHGEGPATEWAARAAIGDQVAFDQPRGHYAPPEDATWIALSGDATALPAIGRILEERTARAAPPIHVVISVEDPADRQELPLRAGDTLRWVDADQLVPETLALTETTLPGYLWFAGEASDMRRVRHHLRRELTWPTHRWMTMGYWRRDRERWLARYEAAGEAFHRRLADVYSSDEDDETQTDRAEELYAQQGLL